MPLQVYCSTLQRTISTAERVYDGLCVPCKVVRWRALAEISAGIYDGLTYQEIEARDPHGYKERANDKLNYKYPQARAASPFIASCVCIWMQQLVLLLCSAVFSPDLVAARSLCVCPAS